MAEAECIGVHDLCGLDLGETVENHVGNFINILSGGSVWALPTRNSKTTDKLRWLPPSKA